MPMIVALGISGYLTYASVTASEIAGCGGGAIFDCGHVLYSKWSKFIGFPVSGLALGTYIAMIGATLVTGWARLTDAKRDLAWTAVTGLAIAASLAAIYFIALQVFVLKHLCSYCLVAHACGLLIASTVLLKHRVGTLQLSSMSGLAAAGLALLVVVQVNSEAPKKYKIETFQPLVVPSKNKGIEVYVGARSTDDSMSTDFDDDLFAPPSEDDDLFAPPSDDIFDPPIDEAEDDIDTVEAHIERVPESTEPTENVTDVISVSSLFSSSMLMTGVLSWQEPATQEEKKAEEKAKPKKERRIVKFQGETIKLDAAQWPLAGAPDAKHIFVEMFDYTCPHCRSTYGAIRGAKEKFGDDLSIMVLPVPLNSACNPLIQKNNPSHAESCQLSQLAVCVWRADAEKFAEFHDWMFEEKVCPTYSIALTKAIEIVGRDAIVAELNKPIAAEYIKRHVQLYQKVGGGEVPKILFPTTSVVGEFTSVDELTKLIQEHTGK